MPTVEKVHEGRPQTRAIRVSGEVRDIRENELSRRFVKIGVSGNGGSFSEAAAIKYAQETYVRSGSQKPLDFLIVYLLTGEGVLSALESGKLGKNGVGIFPTMNNHGGPVKENIKAMGEHLWTPENDEKGEARTIELPVKHVLMRRRGASGDVKYIVTQPQAYEQCKATIAALWPTAKVLMYDDTATAAKDLAEPTGSKLLSVFPDISLEHTAVVGPEAAAVKYNLEVKTQGEEGQTHYIQDHEDNRTTFAVVRQIRMGTVKRLLTSLSRMLT